MSLELGLYVRERAPSPGEAPAAAASPPDRAALARAFDVEDDPALAQPAFELGRPETGATCQLLPALVPAETPREVRAQGFVLTPWRLVVPLLRSPTSARDLLPPAVAAVRLVEGRLSGLAGPLVDDDPEALIALWEAAHQHEARRLAEQCRSQGLPPPPWLPREALEGLHAWLFVLARASAGDPRVPPFVHGLDPRDGSPTLLAARVPVERGEARLPPVHVALVDLDARAVEEPRAVPLDALRPFGAVDEDGLLHVVLDDRVRDALRSAPAYDLERYRFVSPVEIVDGEALGLV